MSDVRLSEKGKEPAAPPGPLKTAVNDSKPVALVAMPLLTVQYPSFQLGLLKPTLERSGFPAQTFSLFMYFGAHIGWALNEELAAGYINMIGDWIWAPAAFDFSGDEASYLKDYESIFSTISDKTGYSIEDILLVRREKTFSFLQFCLRSIDWGSFLLVGFSIMMQQMTASLALARVLKENYPELPVIFGGPAFEADMAEEMISKCPQVDYILCGEGDVIFPEMVGRLHRKETMTGLPGLTWRKKPVFKSANSVPRPVDLKQTPWPDFDEYYYAREESGYKGTSIGEEPMLPVETSRGCYWGARCHCIFCGLNSMGLAYRFKDPQEVMAMFEYLSRRYGASSFFVVDNIMPPAYVDQLFGPLAEANCDFNFHYTSRATLTRRQIEQLKQGGLRSLQPGVESLSTRLLQLMRKGTKAIHNVELIKWTTYYDIDNLYYLMIRIPEEQENDYFGQVELISQLPHFKPPLALTPMRADRGSPMFTEPERFFITALSPDPCYPYIYSSDRFDVGKIAYFFNHQMERTLEADQYQDYARCIESWQEGWKGDSPPSLRYRKGLDHLIIEDRRAEPFYVYEYEGNKASLYEFCAESRKLEEIKAILGETAGTTERLVEEFLTNKLMIRLDDHYLSLALPINSNFSTPKPPFK